MKPDAAKTRLIIPPEQIFRAYASGYFPMADDNTPGSPLYFYTAKKRGIIPIESFHVSRRARRYFRSAGYEMKINAHFSEVVTGCADRDSTWISPEIKATFEHLHELGYAHSVEVMSGEELVGGLYGLTLGSAFFAESVFQYAPEAHKAAMYFCHQQLVKQGFTLWDVQFHTDHLEQFGCVEIPDVQYKRLLIEALAGETVFNVNA